MENEQKGFSKEQILIRCKRVRDEFGYIESGLLSELYGQRFMTDARFIFGSMRGLRAELSRYCESDNTLTKYAKDRIIDMFCLEGLRAEEISEQTSRPIEEINAILTEVKATRNTNSNKGRFENFGQLCWSCMNSVPDKLGKRGCEWSMDFLPVPGWDATKVRICHPSPSSGSRHSVTSYDIKHCPKYVHDERFENKRELENQEYYKNKKENEK